jgi:Cof subfamily protein (haloacid dehalogenase superfamily)
MQPRYRLLFIDIDGTLSGGPSEISQANLDALAAARAAGCEIVLCTGRSLYTARSVLEQVDGAYAIVLNGAVVYCRRTASVIRRVTLNAGAANTAVDCIRASGLAALCFGVDDDDRIVYTVPDAPIHAKWFGFNRNRLVFVNRMPADLPRLPIMVAAYDARERVDTVALELERALGTDAMIIRSWAPVYDCWCTEAHSRESGKERAAQEVARLVGVSREETFAIGDNHNDAGLIRWAGLGVAMGDGPAEVRDLADEVTGGLDDDGAAQAIRQFVLGDGNSNGSGG